MSSLSSDRLLGATKSSPDLVAFWDFQEASHQPRLSRGPQPVALEVHGVVERVPDGVLGDFGARFCGRGHLSAPRAKIGNQPLFIGGPDAQVSLVAHLKREKRPDKRCCEFVAGVWNEHSLRQYALFLDLRILDGFQQLGAHVSRTGTQTPGFKYCMEAAIGQTPVPFGEWICAVITYDGHLAKTYLNGVLDGCEGRNPLALEGPLFDGGPNGSDFTVGATARPELVDDQLKPHGSVIANPFYGILGGLAIYKRALSAQEIATLRL